MGLFKCTWGLASIEEHVMSGFLLGPGFESDDVVRVLLVQLQRRAEVRLGLLRVGLGHEELKLSCRKFVILNDKGVAAGLPNNRKKEDQRGKFHLAPSSVGSKNEMNAFFYSTFRLKSSQQVPISTSLNFKVKLLKDHFVLFFLLISNGFVKHTFLQ